VGRHLVLSTIDVRWSLQHLHSAHAASPAHPLINGEMLENQVPSRRRY
jgi:hypothetical protein